MRFTLRQLEYAVAVAKHLNFGGAARACHVSQPALSVQIAQLETALGAKLFDRSARRTAPTQAGRAFTTRAAKILQDLRDLDADARASREPLAGDLRLGVIPTIAPFLVPKLVDVVRRRHPSCRLLLAEERTRTLVRKAEDGELDVLLVALEADLGRLETTPLFKDRFMAAVSADHPKASSTRVSIDDLVAENLLVLEDGHCFGDQVSELCGAASQELGDFRAGSLGTLAQMTAMGHGVTLIPELAATALRATPNLVLLPLSTEAFRTIGLSWRPGHPRASEFRLLADAIGGEGAADPAKSAPAARKVGRSKAGVRRPRSPRSR